MSFYTANGPIPAVWLSFQSTGGRLQRLACLVLPLCWGLGYQGLAARSALIGLPGGDTSSPNQNCSFQGLKLASCVASCVSASQQCSVIAA